MKSQKRLAAAVIVILATSVLAPVRAHGWGKTWLGVSLEQIVGAARYRLGPLRYDAAFRIGNAGYDSDIYFGQLKNPVPDGSFTAGPAVNLYLPLWRGVVLNVTESPEYVFFLKTRRERTWNNRFRGQLHAAAGAFYFQAGGGADDVKTRMSTELFLNVRYKMKDLGGFVLWQAGRTASLVLQYRQADYSYENPDQEEIDIRSNLDRREDLVSFTAYLFRIAKASIFASVESNRFHLKSKLSEFRDSRSIAVYAGAEFFPLPSSLGTAREKILGRVSLGYMRYRVPDSLFKDYEGFVGEGGVDARLLRTTAFRLDFARDVQFSAFSILGYFVQTSLGAGIVQTLAKNTNISYNLIFGRNDYFELAGSTPGSAPRQEFLTHQLGFGLQLARSLRLGMAASLARRTLNRDERALKRTLLGLTLEYGSAGGLSAPGRIPSGEGGGY